MLLSNYRCEGTSVDELSMSWGEENLFYEVKMAVTVIWKLNSEDGYIKNYSVLLFLGVKSKYLFSFSNFKGFEIIKLPPERIYRGSIGLV